MRGRLALLLSWPAWLSSARPVIRSSTCGLGAATVDGWGTPAPHSCLFFPGVIRNARRRRLRDERAAITCVRREETQPSRLPEPGGGNATRGRGVLRRPRRRSPRLAGLLRGAAVVLYSTREPFRVRSLQPERDGPRWCLSVWKNRVRLPALGIQRARGLRQRDAVNASRQRERRARDGDSDGQREAQEGSQAADNLLQLPAGGPPEEIPVGPVLGPAGEGRAGRAVGPDADTGEDMVPKPALQIQETVQERRVSTGGNGAGAQPGGKRFNGLQLSPFAGRLGKQQQWRRRCRRQRGRQRHQPEHRPPEWYNAGPYQQGAATLSALS